MASISPLAQSRDWSRDYHAPLTLLLRDFHELPGAIFEPYPIFYIYFYIEFWSRSREK